MLPKLPTPETVKPLVVVFKVPNVNVASVRLVTPLPIFTRLVAPELMVMPVVAPTVIV